MRLLVLLGVAALGLASATPARAQQIETPVAFDSAGKVRSLTPQLVARYGLTAPAWPVEGTFVEARLFSISGGAHVLTVERPGGAMERYSLSDADVVAIRASIDAAMTRTGATPVEARPHVISEPARNAFARNQMLLSLALYGPLLASLADDGKTGTALYLLGAGTSFFASLAISKELQVTRAQNHLATDGALRGYGATAAFIYASGADVGRKTYSALGLAGALGGSVLGYKRGKGMTDAEAEAATTISTLAAAAGFGATAAISSIDNTDGRIPVSTMLGAGIIGYAFGPSYPRTARYTVTRGDLQMLSLASILGTAVAFTPIIDEDLDDQVGFGALTAGLIAGAYVGDRALVRNFDYTMSEATQIQLATAAGAAMGGALAVLVEPPAQGVMGLITGGGIIGAMAGHALSNPARAGGASAPERSSGASRLRFDPTALVLAASKSPGRHAVLSYSF
ncbi:MAG TPA: hypothetical protein VFO66_00555 [Gemmatimonadaceae bacterium]|jgi:hypothetical protein|nr:hypothetical protein [Gemmatimonadaceae bacterium]